MNSNQVEWEAAIAELQNAGILTKNRMTELPLEALDLIRGGYGDRVPTPGSPRAYD